MKQLSFLFVLIIFARLSSAQEVEVLPKDETGKYIYYEVVNDVKSTDSLKTRLLDFIAKHKKELKQKPSSDAKVASAEGKIVVQKSLAMISHPTGEITYQFHFEVGEEKYRFWLIDFEFIPYQKDRYGNFVPSTRIGVALETEPKKANTAQWEEYRLQASKYATNFAKRLKDHLANIKAIPPLPPPEKKVISKNW